MHRPRSGQRDLAQLGQGDLHRRGAVLALSGDAHDRQLAVVQLEPDRIGGILVAVDGDGGVLAGFDHDIIGAHHRDMANPGIGQIQLAQRDARLARDAHRLADI